MSEENLPTAEEMRARYAGLMDEEKDEASESTDEESAAGSPQSAEPEVEAEAVAPEPEATEPEAVEPEAPATSPPPPATAVEPEPSDLPLPEPVVEEVPDPAEDLAEHLLDVKVRLWAELGRSRLPLAQTVALGTGAIVDLDKESDDEVDVLVNGLPFAKGKLLLVDGEWAVRLERIVATPTAVEQASSSGSGA